MEHYFTSKESVKEDRSPSHIEDQQNSLLYLSYGILRIRTYMLQLIHTTVDFLMALG
jgi:hypothetical protein